MKLIHDDGTEFTVESVQVIELDLQDVVVVKVGKSLDHTQFLFIQKGVSEFFPDNKVLVLDVDLDLDIVKRVRDEKPE
jgi:hypothetical protein